MKPRLLYVTDALCGWCYATGPGLARALEPHREALTLEVISFGLCPGDEAFVVRDGQAADLRREIDRIVERSGAAFGERFLERFTTPGERFDSQPAAEALVAVRHAAPEAALEFLHAVQRAIYVDGADPADRALLRRLAVAAGADAAEYDGRLARPDIADLARGDYTRAAALEVKIVPTLLQLQDCGAPAKIFSGYVEEKTLAARIADLLLQAGGVFAADGPACGIDGCCE